jgi:hypothetical protein
MFECPPQQSDYSAAWTRAKSGLSHRDGGFDGGKTPSFFQRLFWKAQRVSGIANRQVIIERRTFFQNQQLGIDAQPDIFRAVAK